MARTPDDARGKAALDQLQARPTTAERLLARLGPRGFARPRVAVSARIFRKYRVADPWDPDPKEVEDPIELGPVSVKLGERRKVAPHLAPPEAPKKKAPAAAVDPIAKYRPKPGSGPPTPKPAPAAPEKGAATAAKPPPAAARPPPPPPPAPPPPGRGQPPSELAREFGARDARQPLRKPLPMRPDRAPSDGAPAPAPAVADTPRSLPPVARPSAPPARPASGGTAGRLRMQSTATTSPVEVRRPPVTLAEEQVVVDEVLLVGPAAEGAPEAPASPPKPPVEKAPARPPMPPKGDSLDDLFGMAAMGGRMTLGRRKGEE
ncbi:hypothetical protein L6R53_27900 [Myxococcota bacterium]|nr:hypothetical protein [Myxococcota bacterium]